MTAKRRAQTTATEDVTCYVCGDIIQAGQPCTWPRRGPDKGKKAHLACKSWQTPAAGETAGDTHTLTANQIRELVKEIVEKEARSGKGLEQLEPGKSAASSRYHERSFPDGAVWNLVNAGTRNFLFTGETGTGKTELAKHIAFKKGVPGLVASMTPDNPLKEYFVNLEIRDGSTSKKPGKFVEYLQRPSVICLDEFNMLPAKYQAKVFELLSSGKLFLPELNKDFEKHPDCVLILTGNPQDQRYKGAEALNEAIVERTQVIRFPHFSAKDVAAIIGCKAEAAKYLCAVRDACDLNPAIRATVGIRLMIQVIFNAHVLGCETAIALFQETLKTKDSKVQDMATTMAVEHLGKGFKSLI